MHLKHTLSSMMLFRLMQTGGMIFLIKMIGEGADGFVYKVVDISLVEGSRNM